MYRFLAQLLKIFVESSFSTPSTCSVANIVFVVHDGDNKLSLTIGWKSCQLGINGWDSSLKAYKSICCSYDEHMVCWSIVGASRRWVVGHRIRDDIRDFRVCFVVF